MEQKAIFGPIVLQGQATVIYAKPNVGKTLFMLSFIMDGIRRKLVDPSNIIYLNMDELMDSVATMAEVRMHDLRHSFASNLVNAGQSIYVVGRLLGHSQVKTTQRYAHLSDVTLHAAVEAAANAAGAPRKEEQRASA